MSSRLRLVVAFVAAVSVVAACGGGSSVGDQSALEFDQKAQGEALGATSSTAKKAAVSTSSTSAGPSGTTQATSSATTAPPEKQQVTLDVSINDASPYFEPSHTVVRVGSKVRFTNKGTNTYSVVSDTGEFESGPIAPGSAWIFQATTLGRFNYSDGGRPFAVGSIEVVQ